MANPMLSRRLESPALPPIAASAGMTVGETIRNTLALLLAVVAGGSCRRFWLPPPCSW
ncbi:MAG TPA: hypothetical protein VLB85_00575 [Acidimicrobiia bacterium]|nr:hypothetical protein [Acidimicrobiia bacterium]